MSGNGDAWYKSKFPTINQNQNPSSQAKLSLSIFLAKPYSTKNSHTKKNHKWNVAKATAKKKTRAPKSKSLFFLQFVTRFLELITFFISTIT
jgi:hypothetical protein